ncbi:MAG: hypothetical protein WBA54_08175, partial [Acidaminobacteraceae bacterium]
MKIKNKIVVFYLAIIIIPFILVLSLSKLYMNVVKEHFDKEITQVIDQSNETRVDKIEFLTNTLKEYTQDGVLDDMEIETLRLLFNKAIKIPLIININDEEVFRTSRLPEATVDNIYTNIEYINAKSDKIDYSYIELIKFRKPVAVDIFKYYSGLSFKVAVGFLLILSLLF